MLNLLRKIKFFVDPAEHWRLVGLFVLMALTAILDMVSIGLILPVVKFISEPESAGEWLPGFMADMGRHDVALTLLLGFGGFFIIKTVAIFLMVHVTNETSAGMMARFMTRVFRRYLRRPYLTHLVGKSSEMMYNTVLNCLRAFESLRVLLNIMLEGFMAFATGLLLFFVQPLAAISIGILFVIVGYIFYRIAGPIMQRWGSVMIRTEQDLIDTSVQAFHSLESIKIHHCEQYFEDVFSRLARTDNYYRSRSSTFQHVPRLVVESLMIVGFVIGILTLLSIGQDFNDLLPVIGLFLMAFLRLMPSLNRILQYVAELRHREPAIDLLYNELRSADEADVMEEAPKSQSRIALKSEIRLEDVHFSYPGSNRPALRGLDLVIHRGESVGLVGPSGAGKSTLAEIIKGLIPPSKGRLLVDGRDAYENLDGWHANLSFVPQSIYLLDDTLRRNVAFGVPDAEIDEARVHSAMEMAHMDSYVSQLADGPNTRIGENGIRLSGGQRQRLGIARALYRDPNVLVFDEATSDLDSETEYAITKSIEELSGRKTLIIIAHRLSTVHKCDRLVFLKDGRIDDIGNFDELMERNDDFRRMAQIGRF